MIIRGLKSSLLAVAMAVCCASLASAQAKSTAEYVPTDAGGFLHVNVELLLAAEQFELATDLINRVDLELAEVFQRHLGVNALRLKEATIMLPPLAAAFEDGSDDPAMLGFFAFGEGYEAPLVLDGIGGTWIKIENEKSLYYRNEQGLTVLFLNQHTFLCGAENALQWWLATLGAEPQNEALVNAKVYAQNGAALTVALNTADMPAELLADLPLPLLPFAQSEAVILSVDVDDEFELFVAVDYPTPADASRAERNLRSLIDLGRTMLRQHELDFEKQIAAVGASLEETLSTVGLLAVVRHADAHLQNIRIDREGYQLQADLTIDTPAPVLVAGALAAIAAIGAEEETEFANVGEQLNGAE